MSRSCHKATSSSAGITLARSTRASPQSCSHFTGFRLCGIALEPFCAPARNGSCTSASSVCCNRRISSAHASMPAPSDAHAYSSSAWRSRAITCVAGTGASPRWSHTYASTSGSICEYVPTAPDSLPTAIAALARATRTRSRRTWSAQSASLAPNVVGSAWTPCVRPTIGVPRCSRARAAMATSSSSTAVNRRSHARTRVTDRAVSTTSLEVRPWCTQAPSGRPTRSWTTSTKAATSCSVVRSRSSMAATSKPPRSRIAVAASGGTTPSLAWASTASSSTSSQVA